MAIGAAPGELVTRSSGWEQLCAQEGVPCSTIDLAAQSLSDECSLLIVNRTLSPIEREVVDQYLRAGGAIVGYTGHLHGVADVEGTDQDLAYLVADHNDVFSSVHLIDLGVRGIVPRGANTLRTDTNTFGIATGPLGVGYGVVLPFDVDTLFHDARSAYKSFYFNLDRLPAERVSLVGKGELRPWRLEKEYGNGHLVDWGIHLIDAIRVALGESTPRSVSASGGLYQLQGRITTPDTLTAWFEFERCPVTWRHRLWGSNEYTPELNNGILFFGDKETVFATDGRWEVISSPKVTERKAFQPTQAVDAQIRHVGEFLDAVRAGRQPSCRPEDAADSAATVQLAMISYYSGSKVVWDASKPISSNAWRFQSKPPVSTSTTTGRKPRKREARREGAFEEGASGIAEA